MVSPELVGTRVSPELVEIARDLNLPSLRSVQDELDGRVGKDGVSWPHRRTAHRGSRDLA